MIKTVCLCLLISFLLVAPVTAQDASTDVIDPALDAQMIELESWTENQRELQAEAPVAHAFPTRQEVQAYIEEQYRTQLTPELAKRSLAFYAALGMLPPETDLIQLFIDVLGSQVAGFYDSDTGVMNVIPFGGDEPLTELSLLEAMIYVHEYTHALQDQAFDLDNFVGTEELLDHPDRALASLSLVEGDATAVMAVYLQEAAFADPAAALALLGEDLLGGGLMPPEDIPPALLRELTFPYETGWMFVMALLNEGGWQAVNQAFENPPTTSEQILHPDKYLAGEVGQPIELQPVDEVLDDAWTQVWNTALGEFYLGEHLRTHIEADEAFDAAAGWGGDQFQIYTHTDGQITWLLKLAWDTEEDAAEFGQIYEQFNGARIAEGGSVESLDEMTCYVAETTICVANDGTTIASAPTLELASALLETQLQ